MKKDNDQGEAKPLTAVDLQRGVRELAFRLHRTQQALDTANIILKEEGCFGITVDLGGPTLRQGKKEKAEINKIIKAL